MERRAAKKVYRIMSVSMLSLQGSISERNLRHLYPVCCETSQRTQIIMNEGSVNVTQ